jgi:hypothetical protein
MPPISFSHCHLVLHRLNQPIKIILPKLPPSFLDEICKLMSELFLGSLKVFNIWINLIDEFFELSPDMLDWVQIWGYGGESVTGILLSLNHFLVN